MRTNKDQLNLGPIELENVSPSEPLRNVISQDVDLTSEQADVIAAQLFDEALKNARIPSSFVAAHLGVSESLVSRWRSPNYREQPSFAQMLRLPFSFQLGLHRAMNARFGFGRAALRDLLDAAGLLAVNG